jgi:cell division protein FtsZ
VLLNITGGPSLSLHEVDEAASIIREAADPQANIIVGQVINPDMGEDLVVTVIATGFDREEPSGKPASLERPASASVRALQPALAAARASGGELPSKNLERPTFLRRLTAKRDGQGRLGLIPDDEWDVPTFLRKQSE